MAVQVFGASQPIKSGQLLYVASPGAAVINLDSVPAIGRLVNSGAYSLIDRVKVAIV